MSVGVRRCPKVMSNGGGALQPIRPGLAIYDLPDSSSAAAVSLAVSSSGAFSHFETHELVPVEQFNAILEKANQLTYRPPGNPLPASERLPLRWRGLSCLAWRGGAAMADQRSDSREIHVALLPPMSKRSTMEVFIA